MIIEVDYPERIAPAFCDLREGDLFISQSTIYVKIESIYYEYDEEPYNAIELATGAAVTFDNCDQVSRYNGTIHLDGSKFERD